MKPESEWEYEEESPTSFQEARMSFLAHLAELRKRILYSVIAVLVGFFLCWTVVQHLFEFLLVPLKMGAPELDLAQMHHKDLAEPIFTFLKTAIVGGIFVASPVIIYNIWQFVGPGLYPSERRVAIPFVALATFFFFLGAGFCYLVVIPFGYQFLLEFSLAVSEPTLMMNEYFALTTKLLLGFGLVFEMPVVAMVLSMVGIITHRTLLKHWRIAVVGAFIVAAILTPPDVVTQALMAGPLVLLYFISVGVAWFFTSRRERKLSEEERALLS